jgi:hypothetical protein
MKKILLTLAFLIFGLTAFATETEEALNFFNNFVQASNNYSSSLLNMYSDNAKIIRQVVKSDGSTVNVPFSINDYRRQLRLSSKIAKLRNYKNNYSNITIVKVPNGYKINSVRTPSLSKDKLKASIIVRQVNEKWLIIEELMQTREQIFLKYAK